MPYIENRKRKRLDEYIEKLPKGLSKGQSNYLISKIVDKLYGLGGYSTFCDAIGTLECIKMEFYRRIVSTYEDYKKDISGDVYNLPYAAGLLDGEGCISITGYNQKKRKGYHLLVSIANTNKECLKKVQHDVKLGKIYSHRKKEGCKQVHILHFTQKESLDFLQKVCPFLIIKKKEAELAIEFQRKKIDKGTGYNNIEWQFDFFRKFRELKGDSKEEIEEKINKAKIKQNGDV